MINSDFEKHPLICILTSCTRLYDKIDMFFDTNNNVVRGPVLVNYEATEWNKDELFTKSERALIRLGYNLYNGFTDHSLNPLAFFSCFDGQAGFVALYPLIMRCNIELNLIHEPFDNPFK